ncbi:cupin domain-containing protein [Rhodoblastus acidophilus]|nr:cupin domain-containing protein [Rhodoblastus acidophilus]
MNVLGERITVLVDSGRSGGLELFRQQGDAGQGPPPHAHEWDETFYIVTGEVEIGAGDLSQRLGPGAVAHVPAGVTHWFRFVTDGEMISVTSRAGASRLFGALDAAIKAGATEKQALIPVILENGAVLRVAPQSARQATAEF